MMSMRTLLLVLCLSLGLPCLATVAIAADAPSAHPPGAAIASAHERATQAGLETIRDGGNAFDAAVTVSSVLSVVEPISSGLGGGGFFLLHDARTGRNVFLDAREIAPEAATPEVYLDAEGNLDPAKAESGPWSAGLPGLPAALVKLAKEHGKLPLSRTLAPAIRIAEEGFPVYARLERGYAGKREILEQYPGTRALFLADGDPPKVGETLRQPDLARTLRLIAEKGFDGFYRGDVAAMLVAGVNAQGGKWTTDELAAYAVRERAPISFDYSGWNIVTAPPTSSGGVALAEMLNMASGWDLSKLDRAERVHILVEAMRRAYRDRTIYLGDPDFTKVPMERLLSPLYAAGLRATIHPDKATPSGLLPGHPAPLEDEETTHFSIIDAEGNMVSATQTINLLYGSGLVPPGTGVILNDEMDDFALKPGTPNAFGVMGFEANAVEPGKRMLSSMTPTFMFSPEKVTALGAPGGSRIITEVLLGILGYDDGLSAEEVAAKPRFHHQWWPDVISAEPGALDADTIAALEAMGHEVSAGEGTWGILNTVAWDRLQDKLSAGADPRNPVGSGEVMPQP